MIDTSIYHVTFLSHGESVGNAEDRFQGHADFPLTDMGRTQARSLPERWQVDGFIFDWRITSPRLRARQTAEIFLMCLKSRSNRNRINGNKQWARQRINARKDCTCFPSDCFHDG